MNFKKKSLIIVFVSVLASIVALLLMPYSRDYDNYKEIFDVAASAISFSDSISSSELVYTTLAYLTNSVFVTFMTLAVLSIVIKLNYFGRLNKYAWIAILYYFSRFFLVHEVTQIRISFGIAMLLVAFNRLHVKEYRLGFLFLLLAAISHSSTLIYIPIIFYAATVKNPLKSLKRLIVFIGFLIVTVVLFKSIGFFYELPIENLLALLPDGRLQTYYLEIYDFEVPSLFTDVFLYLKILSLVSLLFLSEENSILNYEIRDLCMRSGIVFLFSIIFFVSLHDLYAIASRLSDIAAPFEALVMAVFIVKLSRPSNVSLSPLIIFLVRLLLTFILITRLFIAQLPLLKF